MKDLLKTDNILEIIIKDFTIGEPIFIKYLDNNFEVKSVKIFQKYYIKDGVKKRTTLELIQAIITKVNQMIIGD